MWQLTVNWKHYWSFHKISGCTWAHVSFRSNLWLSVDALTLVALIETTNLTFPWALSRTCPVKFLAHYKNQNVKNFHLFDLDLCMDLGIWRGSILSEKVLFGSFAISSHFDKKNLSLHLDLSSYFKYLISYKSLNHTLKLFNLYFILSFEKCILEHPHRLIATACVPRWMSVLTMTTRKSHA